MNRDYLISRMRDEMEEMMRVLQLTSADDDEEELNKNRKNVLMSHIQDRLQIASDWIRDPESPISGHGTKCLRETLSLLRKLKFPHLTKGIEDGCSMTESLCEMKRTGNENNLQARESLAKALDAHLKSLVNSAKSAVDQNADEGATVAKNTRTPGDLFDW